MIYVYPFIKNLFLLPLDSLNLVPQTFLWTIIAKMKVGGTF